MSEKLNFDTLARKLIDLVGGDESEVNVEGVITVLSSMAQGINLNWELWLAQETNDLLAQDCVCCSGCGAPIRVTRERTIIYVDEC